jgi:hypothetical protein
MLTRVLAVVAALSLASPILAGTIFSNFGPGDSFDPGGQTLSVGSPIGEDDDQGSAFTPSSNLFLTRIELAVGLASGPNLLDVWLMSDSGGQPNTIIESFHLVDAMGPFAGSRPLVSADSILHPLLSAGIQYWLIADTPGPDELAAWNFNSIGDIGPNAFQVNSGGWFVGTGLRDAFRVSGSSSIPEPNTLLLVLLGGAMAGAAAFGPKRTPRSR